MEQELLQNSVDKSQKLKEGLSKYIYDISSFIVLFAMFFLEFGSLEFNTENLLSLLGSYSIILMGTIIVDRNYYLRGSTIGKQSTKYITNIKAYSEEVSKLTGEDLEMLPDFCRDFNEKALRNKQISILRGVCISYEQFNNNTEKTDCEPILALKLWSKKDLLAKYGKEITKGILLAKKQRVVGIKSSTLLTENKPIDDTDIGKTEKELKNSHSKSTILGNVLSTIILSIFAIDMFKNFSIGGFGWFLFRCSFIIGKGVSANYSGYNDVVLSLCGRYARKTDILKEFFSWKEKKQK